MAITGKEDISRVRKNVKESQSQSLQTTKTLIFKHQATLGQLVIDTLALTPPAESLANGFVQDNPASVNLLVNKKNLQVHSSRGVWLQLYDDFQVTGANTITFVGNIAAGGGALEGEIFTIYAVPVQANSFLTTDHKKQYQEYLLPAGQTLLNLGREYEVNRNANSQIGSIRVFKGGQGPLLRNVGNADAAPLADGNYQEIAAGGTTLGTTIEFNVASVTDQVVVVEFGLEYAGDFSMVGDIQSIYGMCKKIIADVAPALGYLESRYYSFNASEVERRTFGDLVYNIIEKIQIPQYVFLGALPVLHNWGVNPSVTGLFWQDGDFLVADILFSLNGAPAASTLVLNLPAGYTFNTSKMTNAGAVNNLVDSIVSIHDDSASPFRLQNGVVQVNTSTGEMTLKVVDEAAASTHFQVTVDNTTPITFANNDRIQIKYRVPVNEFGTGKKTIKQLLVEAGVL